MPTDPQNQPEEVDLREANEVIYGSRFTIQVIPVGLANALVLG